MALFSITVSGGVFSEKVSQWLLFAHGWCLALVLLGRVDALQWREEKHPVPEPSFLTRTCARTFLMFSRLFLSMLDAA